MSKEKTKRVHAYPIPTVCDYCGAPVIYTSNAEIYGREYGNGKCYRCTRCDSHVGVHTGTEIPLGRLANKELRTLKVKCHNLFDPVWAGKRKVMSKGEAYKNLARVLGIPPRECHVGWFDVDMLLKALEILRDPHWYRTEVE